MQFRGPFVTVRHRNAVFAHIHASFLDRDDGTGLEDIVVPDECAPECIDAAVCAIYGISHPHPPVAALACLDAMDAPDEAYATLDSSIFDRGEFHVEEFVPYLQMVADKLPKTWNVIKRDRTSSPSVDNRRHPELWTPDLPTTLDRQTRAELLDMLALDDAARHTKKSLITALHTRENAINAVVATYAPRIRDVYERATASGRANKWGDWTLDATGAVVGIGTIVRPSVLPPRLYSATTATHLTRDQAEDYHAELVDMVHDMAPRLSDFVCT